MSEDTGARSHGKKRGRAPMLSLEQCKQIAAAFDGTTTRIDALLVTWSKLKPGLKRHNIVQAAKRGGYETSKQRKTWSKGEDKYIAKNWHRMSADAIAAALGRSFDSVNLRRKRLGIGRYDGEDLTVRDIEELTRLDHRQWHEFIDRAWLRARKRGRRNGAAPITYVSLRSLRSLLLAHPEVYDYRAAPKATRVALELDGLPDPPAWKRVVCRVQIFGGRLVHGHGYGRRRGHRDPGAPAGAGVEGGNAAQCTRGGRRRPRRAGMPVRWRSQRGALSEGFLEAA